MRTRAWLMVALVSLAACGSRKLAGSSDASQADAGAADTAGAANAAGAAGTADAADTAGTTDTAGAAGTAATADAADTAGTTDAADTAGTTDAADTAGAAGTTATIMEDSGAPDASGDASESDTGGKTLVSIVVTPTGFAIARNTTLQLTATGFFADGTTQDLTTMVTWVSTNPSTATISNAAGTQGQATAKQTGTTVISATSGTVSDSTTLSVLTVPLLSVVVTPASPSIVKGSKLQLIATARFGDNTTRDVTSEAAWASSNVATATISNVSTSSGQATALAVGTTVISATLAGSLHDSTTLTVTAAAP